MALWRLLSASLLLPLIAATVSTVPGTISTAMSVGGNTVPNQSVSPTFPCRIRFPLASNQGRTLPFGKLAMKSDSSGPSSGEAVPIGVPVMRPEPVDDRTRSGKKREKVVLAYSGGLDTSIIIAWLKETYGYDVICMTADIGQGDLELEGLERKAMASGASAFVVKDLRLEFLNDFVFPCVRADAKYEGRYLLGTAMARPLIAKALVDVAKEYGADALSHGCTGKGNDQVRFEMAFAHLAPTMKIIAPWRDPHWTISGREEALRYADERGIPVPVSKSSLYSRDRNIWHLSHEGDILEDLAQEPEENMFMWTASPMNAPDNPEYVKIGFRAGLPVELDGQSLDVVTLISKLNALGARHGIGRLDLVENRVVGIKSRGVYETPGGTILYEAAGQLRSIILNHGDVHGLSQNAAEYGNLVYQGEWFSRRRQACEAYSAAMTESVTGSVTLRLYKGSIAVTARESNHSLYRQDVSSFEQGSGSYDQADATGFINLISLPTKIEALIKSLYDKSQIN